MQCAENIDRHFARAQQLQVGVRQGCLRSARGLGATGAANQQCSSCPAAVSYSIVQPMPAIGRRLLQSSQASGLGGRLGHGRRRPAAPRPASLFLSSTCVSSKTAVIYHIRVGQALVLCAVNKHAQLSRPQHDMFQQSAQNTLRYMLVIFDPHRPSESGQWTGMHLQPPLLR